MSELSTLAALGCALDPLDARPGLCDATRDGRVCIRPAGEKDYSGLPHDQHRAADGKRWYYSDGEREAALKQSLPEYIASLAEAAREIAGMNVDSEGHDQ